MKEETEAQLALAQLLLARKDGDVDRAVSLADQMWTGFGESGDAAVARHVATATVYAGISLFRTNRAQEAARLFDRVIARYMGSPDSELQRIVKDAQDMREEYPEVSS